jgi:Pathogenicity locus
MSKAAALKEFQQIPGVGKSIAADLWNLGFRSVQGLKNQNPEKLYFRQCRQKGMKVDRCMLYVLRCAVYYASHDRHQPRLLKWWNWKDRE